MSSKYTDIKFKKDRVAYIKKKLESDDRWLMKGLVTIYNFQTDDEQNSRATKEHNTVGFTAFDADFLSGMAKRVKENAYLSEKQVQAIRKSMSKYARQLFRIAESK